MKLKTSFSELTTFKKNITRFWPLWVVYLLGNLLVILDSSLGTYDYFAYYQMPELIPAFGVVNILYAAACGLLLFGDLYNTRMCYSLHTVPMRREGLFVSHWCAALCFSLVPNFLVSLYLMAQLEAYWFLALYWLLAVTLQFIFFFGIATVSALLTGNRFALILVYAGFNFISMLTGWVVNSVYLPRMYGVYLDSLIFQVLCPVVYLFTGGYEFFLFEGEMVVVTPSVLYYDYDYFYRYLGLGDGWGYLAVMGVLGLVFAGIAVWLYRKRHLESAGDFIAFPKLKVPACIIITVCVTAVFALLPEFLFGGSSGVWAIVGFVLGFFGSLMLLERRVKVFRLRTVLGFVLMAALLLGSLGAVTYDVFHVVDWTPEAEQVQSVTISNSYPSGLTNSVVGPDYYSSSKLYAAVTDPAQIDEIIDAHQDILDRRDDEEDKDVNHTRYTFVYTLNSGRRVVRSYTSWQSGESWEIFCKYLYTPEAILGYTDWDSFVDNVEGIYTFGENVGTLYARELLEALRKDCIDGHVGMSVTEYYGYLELDLGKSINGSSWRSLSLDSGAKNTIELMHSPGFILGYKDWDAFIAGDHTLQFNGMDIPKELTVEFLEALRLDCENGAVGLGYMVDGYFTVYCESNTSETNRACYLGVTQGATHVLELVEDIDTGAWKE